MLLIAKKKRGYEIRSVYSPSAKMPVVKKNLLNKLTNRVNNKSKGRVLLCQRG